MSGGSRKRGFGDDFPLPGDTENVKMRKEDGRFLHETGPFVSIDDVTLELRSIEDYVGRKKSDAFQQILERLDKSDILVRSKQGQDSPVPEQRLLYMEDIAELRKLLDEHVGKSVRAVFEERLGKMEADDRLIIRKQTNHPEVSNRMSLHVDIPQRNEPLQQELHPSQANELATVTIKEEVRMIESEPNIQNDSNRLEHVDIPLQDEPFQQEQPSQINELSTSAIKEEVQVNESEPDQQNLLASDDGYLVQAGVKDKPPENDTPVPSYTKIAGPAIPHRSPTSFRKASPTTNKSIKAEKKCITRDESFPTSEPSEVPAGFRLRCSTDLELLKCIAWDRSDNVAAKNVLRSRKLLLRYLVFELNHNDVKLNINRPSTEEGSARISDPTYHEFQCGMKMTDVNVVNLLKLFYVIMEFYDVAEASIALKSCGSNGINYNLLKREFGAPKERMDKIKIKCITIESSEMKDFLHWFGSSKLSIRCNPELFVYEPSLISGVDVIEFRKCRKAALNADRFLESVALAGVQVRGTYRWSRESIFRVLNAHRLSGNTGRARKIEYRCHGTGIRGMFDWGEIFESWSRAFEAEHGNVGRRVTLNSRKVAGNDIATLELK